MTHNQPQMQLCAAGLWAVFFSGQHQKMKIMAPRLSFHGKQTGVGGNSDFYFSGLSRRWWLKPFKKHTLCLVIAETLANSLSSQNFGRQSDEICFDDITDLMRYEFELRRYEIRELKAVVYGRGDVTELSNPKRMQHEARWNRAGRRSSHFLPPGNAEKQDDAALRYTAKYNQHRLAKNCGGASARRGGHFIE